MKNKTVALPYRLLAGALAGLIGGLLFMLTVSILFSFVIHLVISVGLGLIFAAFVGPKLHTGGASLVWGEAYGLIWWLVGYLTFIPLAFGEGLYWQPEQIKALFPFLLGQVIAFGAALGLGYYCFIKIFQRFVPVIHVQESNPDAPKGQDIVAPRVQSLLIGGIGGLLGGWIFLLGIQRAAFFPLVAGLLGSDSLVLGQFLHYVIAVTIGLGFGLLFHRDIRSTGAAIVWGMTYGLSWWMLGPMTLRPLLSGTLPDWSLAAAQATFTPLISHMLYGALVGLFYALATNLWNALFVDSDPLNRTRESAGSRSLRGLLMGQGAGVIGGLLFTIVMVATNSLPRVASLVGGNTAVFGFIVHLIIAIIIGSTYGLFFQNAAYSYGSGLGWGLLYGLLWWFLGPGTLFFILLRQPVDWSLASTISRYPALVGHLLYGMGLGLGFQYFMHRYDTHSKQHGGHLHQHRTAGTPASALWAVTLLIAILLPLLLGTTT
ncbi:MAG: hypothetical protein DWQ04_20825 [Chloroflexi bacterium]|nr:MAG: hypothetical protein DWQ04_20825 [Chloroflexota bacterium]